MKYCSEENTNDKKRQVQPPDSRRDFERNDIFSNKFQIDQNPEINKIQTLYIPFIQEKYQQDQRIQKIGSIGKIKKF